MNPIGGHMGFSGVLALRAQILEKSQTLGAGSVPAVGTVGRAGQVGSTGPTPAAGGSGFGAAMDSALKAVNSAQSESSAAGAAYERGETHDIASVMLSRQKASLSFEATLQARNRLLSAYRDVMNMPV